MLCNFVGRLGLLYAIGVRKIEKLAGGALWIEEAGSVAEAGPDILVMGPQWILEFIRLETGTFSFFHDDEIVEHGPGTFGLFLPGFCVVEPLFKDVTWSWVGLAAPGPAPAVWLNRPMVFHLEAKALPPNPQEMIQAILEPRPYQAIDRNTRATPISRKVKAAIDETYRDGEAIAAIAEQVGMSHAHLTRQFKRDYGLSPARYRLQVRVMDAHHKLVYGEDIVDVGYSVGYNDLGRFYSGFRQVCETSPGKIKKRQDTSK